MTSPRSSGAPPAPPPPPLPNPSAALTTPADGNTANFGDSSVTSSNDATSHFPARRSASFSGPANKSLHDRNVQNAPPDVTFNKPVPPLINFDDDDDDGDTGIHPAPGHHTRLAANGNDDAEQQAWNNDNDDDSFIAANPSYSSDSTYNRFAPDNDDDDTGLSPITQAAASSSASQADEVEQAEADYQQNLQEYRNAHGEQWLKNNYNAIQKALDKPKKAKNVPFKLYVVLDGKKHLLIPRGDTLDKTTYKKAIAHVKTQLAETVSSLPDSAVLAAKVKAFEKPVAQSYQALISLGGGSSTLPPAEDILSLGFRIDCHDGQPPKITGYTPGTERVARSSGDGLDFEGFGLITDPPDLTEDQINALHSGESEDD